jgi:hypothetical protein
MSDPIKTRLDRRRQELMLRAELLNAEAAGEGEWSEGARLALHAAWDEMRHLRDVYELMYLVAKRDQYRREGWLE